MSKKQLLGKGKSTAQLPMGDLEAPWGAYVDRTLMAHYNWLEVLSDFVEDLQDTVVAQRTALEGLRAEKNLSQEEIAERFAALDERMKELDTGSSEVKAFAQQQISIVTDAQKAIGIEERVSRLEAALRMRGERRRQRAGNRLTVVGILVAIALGIAGILIQYLP